MLQLVAKSGPLQGWAWPIVAEPLVLGRDRSCVIQLDEPVVSRWHCRVYLEDGDAYVRDLESRNATLVNGESVTTVKLSVGDEVSVGTSIFVVSHLQGHSTPTKSNLRSAKDTSSLNVNAPIYSSENGDSLFRKGSPRTTRELVHLFSLGRELSQAETTMGLVTLLMHHLSEQFAPCLVWIALNDGGNAAEPVILPSDSAKLLQQDALLFKHICLAAKDKRSLLLPQQSSKSGEQGLRTTIIAPIILGHEVLGALVTQTQSPERIYEEGDLEYLIAHAYAVAPYIKAVEKLRQLEVENQRLVAGLANEGPIVGSSPGLTALRTQARDAARSHLSVLILGETGTGKELVARLVHDLSDLSDQPMVIVNCAAIPDELFESEVFGHERGAFTGAFAARKGLLEESNGGTLFLDEIGDLSLSNQARLLRAIETGTFRRLGGAAALHVQVRIIAATNKNLEEEVLANRFRRDLYHRLNAFVLHIPPLRERRGDIPALAEHFRLLALKRDAQGPAGFTPESLRLLEHYPWPGNVRELRNIIERAMVVAKTDLIQDTDFGLPGFSPAATKQFPTLQELEQRHIEEALHRAQGNVKEAAEMLGIGRSTLYRKLSEYGIIV